MPVPAIEYRDVSVTAPNGSRILDGVTLVVARGERVAFLGRSGAGKTTALKVVNGLLPVVSGEMLVEGEPLHRERLVATRRRIGFVMQRPALFPHRTIYENVATVPRLLEWPEAKIAEAVEALLSKLELSPDEFCLRYPRMLSGGQQQRVAIARALVAEPPILLCDEPFSALDPLLRAELQGVLRAVADERPETTLVFVTHDVREAMRVASRIILFEKGRIVAEAGSEEFRTIGHPLARRFVEATWGKEAP